MKPIIYSGLFLMLFGLNIPAQSQPGRGHDKQKQHNNNNHYNNNRGNNNSHHYARVDYNKKHGHSNGPGNRNIYVDRRVTNVYHTPQRYGVMPVYRSSVAYAPSSSIIISNRGINFRYYNGIFYQPMNGSYIVASAPWGARVRTIPVNSLRVHVASVPYYYYYGSFYTHSVQNNEYMAVQPPMGARVDFLPEGASKVYVDGNTYYEVNNTYYKAFADETGAIWYEVVGQK
ncbi:hypothetical protein MYP_3430 [Sporocytophaga myxococcoides]|uniref:Uncharacterized protein n=1 Tax=Sporocytophaga myxococcoides TaxID=153721 RepID=A0A098LGS6_9BACT|nr:DUF6515 family protein [Sporocytophaga myxococcoides]GAL86201.1 hypothetical protein MYP_3430 [Sporocytophaga myxococcoides]